MGYPLGKKFGGNIAVWRIRRVRSHANGRTDRDYAKHT